MLIVFGHFVGSWCFCVLVVHWLCVSWLCVVLCTHIFQGIKNDNKVFFFFSSFFRFILFVLFFCSFCSFLFFFFCFSLFLLFLFFLLCSIFFDVGVGLVWGVVFCGVGVFLEEGFNWCAGFSFDFSFDFLVSLVFRHTMVFLFLFFVNINEVCFVGMVWVFPLIKWWM